MRPDAHARCRTGEVAQLQRYMKKYGWYSGEVDGFYGPVTEAAVRKFQEFYGLEVCASVWWWWRGGARGGAGLGVVDRRAKELLRLERVGRWGGRWGGGGGRGPRVGSYSCAVLQEGLGWCQTGFRVLAGGDMNVHAGLWWSSHVSCPRPCCWARLSS